MSTATLTCLFTDLANYTAKVSRTDREGLLNILRDHEFAVRPVVEEHGGRIVKNIGDSYLCLFPAATDALKAALEILMATSRGGEAVIRIAMTTGDVEEIDGDAFGEPVNLAARILAQTPAGEIWFGEGTRACMNDAELAWEGVGRFSMKGIPGEQSCFRLVPPNRTWLPEAVAEAARERRLVRVSPGEEAPPTPPDPLVLFEGFEVGSPELEEMLGKLPVLEPEALYLVASIIAPGDRHAWTDSGAGLVIGTAEALDLALREVSAPAEERADSASLHLAETMTIGNLMGGDLELAICGLALPAVPFSNVVASYTYDLLPDGSWATRADRSVLRLEVRTDEVLVHALRRGVSAGQRLLKAGDSLTLSDGDELETPAGRYRFRGTSNGYAGVMLFAPGASIAVQQGQTVEVGRNPNPPGLAFPVRPGESNIRWCAGPQAAKARANGFTLDRVLAGRRQAAMRIGQGSVQLTPLHHSCPTYVLTGSALKRVREPVALQIGDKVVAGTTVVGIRIPSLPDDELELAETIARGG